MSLIFQKCGKDDEVIPPPPPPTPRDTLAAGWQKIYIDSSTFIVDIDFVTPQIGFVVGNKYLGKSIDGGLTWTKVNLPDSVNGNLSFLFFLDQNNGWITSPEHFIIRTTDGGVSWKKTLLNAPTDIQFVTPNIGYVATRAGLFKSIDGGASWQKISAAGSAVDNGVFFFDENNGWISGNQYVQATQDGGSGFNKQTDIGFGDYYNIQFTDANNGWVSGAGGGYVWFTKNGGVSWEKFSNLGYQNDVHFFNANDGYISTNNEVYRTSNSGTSLIREVHSIKDKIIEIEFTDLSHGWATAGAYIYRYSK